jgi:AcrR family transcriptional regulator
METRELNVLPGPQALPTIGGEPGERADAARNRRRILAAAERLFEERGVEEVSMDAIACEAGVGKGTLFRRFGDRAGLMHALLDEREATFQESLIRGEPPLGPGAAALDRLCAFGDALVAHLELHGDLLLAAETGGRWVRFNARVYAAYRAHVAMLVREIDPALDDDYLADALLAPLGADIFLYMRRAREMPLDRIAAGYQQLLRRLLGA